MTWDMSLRTGAWLVVAALAACDPGAAPIDEVEGTTGALEAASTGGAEAASSTGEGAEGDAGPLALARDAALTYVLAWSWDGARREGDAWVFETDLGYTVGITAAHSAISQIELVPCATTAAEASDGAVAWLGDLVVGTAHAGHGGTPDASAAAAPIVESWLAAAPVVFGAAKASGAAYCEAHQLSAPIEAVASDGFAFSGETLVVSGFWSAPGEVERHGLEIGVNLSNGRTRPLGARVDWPADVGGDAAIVITRKPARAFDGLVFEELADIDLAFAALGGLMHAAEVTVALRPA